MPSLAAKCLDVKISGLRSLLAELHRVIICFSGGVDSGYLLAEAVRVLILEDIPRLGRSNFNEAKRFVTLIDALYEAKVRLIASAADTPEQLYIEGEGVFEFERTASRLREMQSADWAAGAD